MQLVYCLCFQLFFFVTPAPFGALASDAFLLTWLLSVTASGYVATLVALRAQLKYAEKYLINLFAYICPYNLNNPWTLLSLHLCFLVAKISVLNNVMPV
jgi:hypothetical protein